MNRKTILNILQECGDFGLHEGYAEPGYDDPESGLIATGNWNSQTRCRRIYPSPIPTWPHVENPDATETIEDKTMPRIAAILEKLDIELEREDEWQACEECHKLVRTSPDSYGWTKSYWQGECGITCQNCVASDPEDYLESLEGNATVACTLDIDLEKHGYEKLDSKYQNGLYGGQCDDPQVIAKSLQEQGITRFIFEIDNVGQFYVSFCVWVHKSKLPSEFDEGNISSVGADPAAGMQAALKDASAKMGALQGDGVRVAKCDSSTGIATARLVSPEGFINGKALT